MAKGKDSKEQMTDEVERFADDADGAEAGSYEEPAPELGELHRDYSIPGVDPREGQP
jgi:hypothetical protein